MFKHRRSRRSGGSAASEDSSGSGLFQGTSQSRERQQQLLDCLESQQAVQGEVGEQEAPQQDAHVQGEEGEQEAHVQDEEVDLMGAGGAGDASDGSFSMSFRYY
jgi:phage repressor protein C with HTH and peptisase S24 domain